MFLRRVSLVPSKQVLSGVLRPLASHCKLKSLQSTKDQLNPSLRFTSHVSYSTKVTLVPENESKHGQIAYKGLVSDKVKYVKLFSLSTSMLGLGLQPILFMRASELGLLGLTVGGMCSFFIFLTPVLLHWITKKYVTVLYYKPERRVFTAQTYSFFVMKKFTVFTPEDVMVPAAPGAFTSVLVKGKPLFMDQRSFEDREAYKVMMGYDKPLDWSFPDDIKELQEDQKPEKTQRVSGEDEINKRREE